MLENILTKITLFYIDDSLQYNIDLLSKLEDKFGKCFMHSSTTNPTLQFSEYSPDLVIINITIKNFNSVEIIKDIRNINPNIPILVISSHEDIPKCLDTIALDINAYIIEPIMTDAFVNKITTYAKKSLCEIEKNNYAKIFQNVINSDNSIIIATNGENLLFSNKAFLDFFSIKSNHEFVEKYKNIYGVFEEDEECLHQGLIKNSESFLDLVLRTEDTKRVVKMFDYKDYNFKAFYLHASIISQKHDEIIYLLTFTDITKVALDNMGMKRKAYYDGLTNIYNRRKATEILEYEIKQTKRYNESFCFILLDIDDFKSLNDKFGHLVGDDMLVLLAGFVSERIRETDIFARWGGEEFVLLLPNTNLDEAYILAEDLREGIKNLKHPKVDKMTVSFGITIFKNSDEQATLFKRADSALYLAKKNGKNRIEILN